MSGRMEMMHLLSLFFNIQPLYALASYYLNYYTFADVLDTTVESPTNILTQY